MPGPPLVLLQACLQVSEEAIVFHDRTPDSSKLRRFAYIAKLLRFYVPCALHRRKTETTRMSRVRS